MQLGYAVDLLLQVAHDPEGEHEPHDPPPPAITPSPPMAANNEIARHVFSVPHFGQAIGASAADIARSASNVDSQSRHRYS